MRVAIFTLERDHCRSTDGITVRQVRHPAMSLMHKHSARQSAASSTDCDPDHLASMISLC